MSSLRNLTRPFDAIPLLMESLVLGFAYQEHRRRFILVCDYPDKAPDADRAFLAFVFNGVTDFVREKGDLRKFMRFERSYWTQEAEGAVVVQHVEHSRRSAGGAIKCWLGPNFGGFRVEFTTLTAMVRDAHVQRTGDLFIYRDAASGDELDFCSPFGDIDKLADSTIN